jgi:hypothetical protein
MATPTHRRRPETLRTAMAMAFFCPTKPTSRFPLVTPGELAIKAEANNGSFYVSVRDTGPGIPAADQAKLFQEFQQADNAIPKRTPRSP